MTDFRFQNRRDFLKYTLGAGAALYGFSLKAADEKLEEKGIEKLTIIYTNDTHSRIEPFPDNDAKYAGHGGFAKRAAMIEKIRSEEKNILLLDAGDIFQGTPYFNYYHGEVEYKLMSLMGYDATTFGNHDFDLGCENILQQMPHADFSFLNCNYDLKNTPLYEHKKILPYKIFKRGNLKIGIFGIGIDLENLVDKKFVGDVKYSDPINISNEIAARLRHDEKCDYVICLSHLGYAYPDKKISDITFAPQSKNIDLIIGGHTHTFLDNPRVLVNAQGKEINITQVGWAGIWLGKIEIYFALNTKKFLQNSENKKI